MKITQFKNYALFFIVLLSVACGETISQGDGDSPEGVSPEITLTKIGTETTNCNIIGIDSDTVLVDDLGNFSGLNLELQENIMTTGGEDVYDVVADTEVFALYDEQENAMEVTFTLSVSPNALDIPNLLIYGLENPESDTPYLLSIPADSITCESGDKNTASYEVEFTLMATETDYSACGDFQEEKCDTIEGDEE